MPKPAQAASAKKLTRLRPLSLELKRARSARLMIASASVSARGADRDADGDRDVHLLGRARQHERRVLDGTADALGRLSGLRLVDVGHRDEELLAAEAGHEVYAADVLLEPPRKFLEHGVAGVVTEAVVDRLELVEVDHHHREDAGGLAGAVHDARHVLRGVAAVVDAGQRVDHRHLEPVAHVRAQPVGVALASELGADAGDQFVHVERRLDVVRRAEVEPLGGGLHVAVADDEDDRRLAGFRPRPQRRDEAEAVAALDESLVHDEEVGQLETGEVERLPL
jgi:hypothetical protein